MDVFDRTLLSNQKKRKEKLAHELVGCRTRGAPHPLNKSASGGPSARQRRTKRRAVAVVDSLPLRPSSEGGFSCRNFFFKKISRWIFCAMLEEVFGY
jgi:hypothetical protein